MSAVVVGASGAGADRSRPVELEYETFGDPDGPLLVLVNGLGSQLLNYDVEWCLGFADRGFHVVRFDNRDVGLSTWFDDVCPDPAPLVAAARAGETVDAPYTLADMADDVAGLIGHLTDEPAHVFGVSMGGMIVQRLAIDHRDLVASLTSVMSTTGDRDVGQPTPEAVKSLMTPLPEGDRDTIISALLQRRKVIASPDHWDEERRRAREVEAFERAWHPAGQLRQTLAVMSDGSRTEALRALDVPALVIHGTIDPLVDPSGGVRTADALGCELLLIEDMAHDYPPVFWNQMIDAVTRLAAGVEGA